MVALYLFCLGLGGVLLAASFFTDTGGHDGTGHHSDFGGSGWHQLLSLRNLTYFLFVFGAIGSGIALVRGGTTGMAETLLAAGGGLAVSALVHFVFAYIRRTDSSEMASDTALVGRSAVVTLSVGSIGVGKVELSFGGQRIELLARPFGGDAEREGSEIASGSEVVIVEMVGGLAYVSRADGE